jgi:hypothetical protein
VLPFAADGEGAGRQPPERSANHGCCGGGSDPDSGNPTGVRGGGRHGALFALPLLRFGFDF